MPSPFPGMNPYLEHDDAWHNFHEQFPGVSVEFLVPQLGPDYFVKVDEHVYIHEMPEERRRLWGRSDVHVGRREPGLSPATEGGTAIKTAPLCVTLPVVDRVGMSYIEIRDRRSRRLVTVIELLSPSNKRPGEDREQYLTKRAEIISGQAHFVEIDLLRGWGRMPVEKEVACDYCVLVSGYEDRPKAGFWPIALREPLPCIRVPLLGNDPQPELDLQAILHTLYDRGGYERFIYESEPDPPLAPDDAAWARSLIPANAPRS
jgi:hypothetical protein